MSQPCTETRHALRSGASCLEAADDSLGSVGCVSLGFRSEALAGTIEIEFADLASTAAVGAGEYSNVAEACKATIKVVKKTDCNRKAAKVYDDSFPLYQQLYRSLKDDFKSISALA